MISKFVIYTVLDHGDSLVNIISEKSFDQRFNACLEFNKTIQNDPMIRNAQSVTGGFLWQSRKFGFNKVVETFQRSRQENVLLFYPVHRYIISFIMRVIGANKNRARFYLVFGRF
ncbi:MAG: hypothetical protein ABJH08_12615 [Balneola sp.]